MDSNTFEFQLFLFLRPPRKIHKTYRQADQERHCFIKPTAPPAIQGFLMSLHPTPPSFFLQDNRELSKMPQAQLSQLDAGAKIVKPVRAKWNGANFLSGS
jgi:hypothetical protein